MIIEQNKVFTLTYEVNSGILGIRWPNIKLADAAEVAHSFDTLLQTIQTYQVTRLLMESIGTNPNVPDPEYELLAKKFAVNLAHTKLKKLARIVSADADREKKVMGYTRDIQSFMVLHFKIKEFTNQDEAVAWLSHDLD